MTDQCSEMRELYPDLLNQDFVDFLCCLYDHEMAEVIRVDHAPLRLLHLSHLKAAKRSAGRHDLRNDPCYGPTHGLGN